MITWYMFGNMPQWFLIPASDITNLVPALTRVVTEHNGVRRNDLDKN